MGGDDKITLDILRELMAPVVGDIKEIKESMKTVIRQNDEYAIKIDVAAESFELYRIDHQEDHKRIEAEIKAMSGLLDCNIEKVDDKVSECQKNCIKTLQPIWKGDIESAIMGTENKDMKKKMSILTKIGIAAVSILGPLAGFFANKFFGVTK